MSSDEGTRRARPVSDAAGRKLYVDSVLSKLPKENLHLNTEIVSVRSVPEGVELMEAGGARHVYDHVIMA